MIRATSSGSAPTLRSLLETYTLRKSLKPSSARRLRYSVNAFCRQYGDLGLDDITETLLSEWVRLLEQCPGCRSARTVIGHRANVLTLLRLAADDGIVGEPNGRKIRLPQKQKPMPWAWTHEEIGRLLSVTQNLTEWLRAPRHCPAATYWTCLIRIAYESGLRRGNLFALRQRDVTDGGTIYVRHEKTGEPHVCDVLPETVALFRQLPGANPLRWDKTHNTRPWWQRLCREAGIRYGCLQQVRKTGATLVWIDNNEDMAAVQKYLGHLTPTMPIFYVDTSQGKQRPPRPPRV